MIFNLSNYLSPSIDFSGVIFSTFDSRISRVNSVSLVNLTNTFKGSMSLIGSYSL